MPSKSWSSTGHLPEKAQPPRALLQRRHEGTPGRSLSSLVQNARREPVALSSSDILQLQGALGNRVVNRLLTMVTPSSTKAGAGPGVELPRPLRANLEQLSGVALDDVTVHRDSPEPGRMGALAYASGTEIHLARGEEQHLAHEAWHLVQQRQGRVRRTEQIEGRDINGDPALEHEAEAMGARARDMPARHVSAGAHARGPASVGPQVAQLYKLNGPFEIKKKLREVAPGEYDDSAAFSVAKELPSWYVKTRQARFADHDFENDGAFLAIVNEMVEAVDSFTDQQGYALEHLINTAQSTRVPIGYKGGNLAYAEKLVNEGLKDRGAPKDPGAKKNVTDEMQIGAGEYIATEIGPAREYAEQRTTEGKDGVVYRVYVDLEKVKQFPILLKGVSVREWWKFYNTGQDAMFDVIVAAISGEPNRIQFKVNPRAYHILSFEVIETHKAKV